MLEDTVTEGWEEGVESWEEVEGWEEDVESWESWEETESWEDDADVVLFRIWSRGGVERGAVSWGRGVVGVEEFLAAVGVVGVEVLAALACGWGVADVWPVEAKISAGTERVKGCGLLVRVVDESRWLLGWEGVEDFLRDIFIFKVYFFFRKEWKYFFVWEEEIVLLL